MDLDARSVALGGATTGLIAPEYAPFSNPAALGFSPKKIVSLGFIPVIFDTRVTPLLFSIPVKQTGVWALSLAYLSGNALIDPLGIDEFDRPVELEGEFRDYELTGGLSWSKQPFVDLSVGINAKLVYHSIGSINDHSSASAFLVDVGSIYRINKSRVTLGLMVHNAGALLSVYNSEFEDLKLPTAISAGITAVPDRNGNLRLMLDLDKPVYDYLKYQLGLEAQLFKKYLVGRIGYGFSQPDLIQAWRSIFGNGDENYVKSDLYTLRLGFGILSDFAVGHTIKFDVAYSFYDNGIITPNFFLSASYGF